MASNHLTTEQRERKYKRAAKKAISRGSRLGRPPTLNPEQVAEIVRLYDKELATFRWIAEEFGVNFATVQRAYQKAKQAEIAKL